jgi:uncharacterized protein (TIGR03382 family)
MFDMNLYRYLKGVGVASALCLAFMPGRASALIIDHFDVNQAKLTVEDDVTTPVYEAASQLNTGAVLGGQRDLLLWYRHDGDGDEGTLEVAGHALKFHTGGIDAGAYIVWDGDAVGDTAGTAPHGLDADPKDLDNLLPDIDLNDISVDFLAECDISMAALHLRLVSADLKDSDIEFTAWDSGGVKTATLKTTFPDTATPMDFNFLLSSFTYNAGWADADWTSVNAFSMQLNVPTPDAFGFGIESLDLDVDLLEITCVPEPATMAFLGLGVLPLLRRRRKAA